MCYYVSDCYVCCVFQHFFFVMCVVQMFFDCVSCSILDLLSFLWFFLLCTNIFHVFHIYYDLAVAIGLHVDLHI